MYSEQFKESLALVEAAREKNISLEPVRMTAEQKEKVLASFHPDYKVDEFAVLEIGPNKGDKVPKELAEILQAHSRITEDSVNLDAPDYECVLAVEMEASALYMNAARSGNEALCICTISDSLVTHEDTTPEQREKTFTDMMEIAFEII